MSLQYEIRNLEGAKEQLGERLFYQAQCTSCHIPRDIKSLMRFLCCSDPNHND